jgi:hypothetical protein
MSVSSRARLRRKVENKFWLLKRYKEPEWEEYRAMVVSSATEGQARVQAASFSGETVWTDPDKTSCSILLTTNRPGVVIADNKGS